MVDRLRAIEGDPATPDLWREVVLALMQTYRRDDGRPISWLHVSTRAATLAVYAFAKEPIGHRIWAIKGESARTGQRSPA